ncbi:MAG: energy-coupling factor transporter ATPase [Tissierellia bacterium]|nr:energy-coupling factor transporter ATPase [Tissierellia bacterium]
MSIELKNINYIYNQGTVFEGIALRDINIKIEENEFIGLIGHTGSGKSTMVQLLNGLLQATSGEVSVDGDIIDFKDRSNLKAIRQKVGLVFQYPEYQLFEETIAKDIGFGPKNLGLDSEEIEKRVKESMELVGLEYDTMKDLSPFELSGGQKRRVAIASVLAMKPKYLVLDEPTAGLDPRGRDDILMELRNIYENDPKLTVILVSHSMEDIAKLANRVIVMHRGEVFDDDIPKNVYSKTNQLEEIGLDVPQITKAMCMLREKGIEFDETIITVEEALNALLEKLGGAKNE